MNQVPVEKIEPVLRQRTQAYVQAYQGHSQLSSDQAAARRPRQSRPSSAKVHKHKRVAEAWQEEVYDDFEPSIGGDADSNGDPSDLADVQVSTASCLSRAAALQALEPTEPPFHQDGREEDAVPPKSGGRYPFAEGQYAWQ